MFCVPWMMNSSGWQSVCIWFSTQIQIPPSPVPELHERSGTASPRLCVVPLTPDDSQIAGNLKLGALV